MSKSNINRIYKIRTVFFINFSESTGNYNQSLLSGFTRHFTTLLFYLCIQSIVYMCKWEYLYSVCVYIIYTNLQFYFEVDVITWPSKQEKGLCIHDILKNYPHTPFPPQKQHLDAPWWDFAYLPFKMTVYVEGEDSSLRVQPGQRPVLGNS